MPYILPTPTRLPGIGAALGQGLGEGLAEGTDRLLDAYMKGQLSPLEKQKLEAEIAEIQASTKEKTSMASYWGGGMGTPPTIPGMPTAPVPQAAAPPQFRQVPSMMGGNIPVLSPQRQQPSTPPAATPPQEAMGLTGVDMGTSGVKYKYGETPGQKDQRELEAEPQMTRANQLAKRKLQTEENYRKAVGQYEALMGQFKTKLIQQGGKGGVVAGGIGTLKAMMKLPNTAAIETFTGQIIETTLAMNPVLTGQNRVIKGITDRIAKTIPGWADTEQSAPQKISQSLTNMYRLTKAVADMGLTSEMFEGMSGEDQEVIGEMIAMKAAGLFLSPEEEAFVEETIQQVLNTPPVVARDLPDFEGGKYIGDVDIYADPSAVTPDESLTTEESEIVQRLMGI